MDILLCNACQKDTYGEAKGRAISAVEDFIGEVATWPRRARDLLDCDHLDHDMRFYFTVFLLANGTPPSIVMHLYIHMSCLRDLAAQIDVLTIIKNYQERKLCNYYQYFNVYTRRAQFVNEIASNESN